eukprot:CAMPEP_0178402424 /NCGR_PEP_ID=MMETSP0689_2-20121128/16835_1 /TAXON_ID=160604 /ORGANISM="Amphidinium massartii, Strain CS-259" /LENGTH=89 /DNA_ID=CAMNT_0020023325 /DNA_START=74 /DNA_END=340 /DNA_ORIENTATION=+
MEMPAKNTALSAAAVAAALVGYASCSTTSLGFSLGAPSSCTPRVEGNSALKACKPEASASAAFGTVVAACGVTAAASAVVASKRRSRAA